MNDDYINPAFTGRLDARAPEGVPQQIYKNASEFNCFQNLRSTDPDFFKVGIIPYYYDNEGYLRIRLAAPAPTKDEDKGKELPFQMSRGCRDIVEEDGTRTSLRTISDLKEALAADKPIESPMQTAIHEAEEELGVVLPGNMRKFIDCGALRYDSETNGSYGIQTYAVEVKDPSQAFKPQEDTSRDAQWFSRPELDDLIKKDNFKPDYQPMLDAVMTAINKIHRAERFVD